MLTWGYNVSGGNSGNLLFVLSLICWEVSCAHFNNSISLGTLVFNRQDFKENFTPFAILTFVQFIGSLLGILLTYLTVNHEYSGGNDQEV